MKHFKILFLALIIAITFTSALAEDIKSSTIEKDAIKIQKEIEREKSKSKDIALISESGKEVSVNQLYGSLLRPMVPSEKFIHSYTSSGKAVYGQKWHRSPPEMTNEIPVISGYYFGFMISLKNLEPNDSVMLRVVDTIPQPIDMNGKKEQVLTQNYRIIHNNKLSHMMIPFDEKTEKELMQYGTWKKEIFNKDKLVYSEEFHLVPPSAEEKQLYDAYEKYTREKKLSDEKKLKELHEAENQSK